MSLGSGSGKWDKFFLGLARYYSSASKDPSSKVGAVITSGKEVVSMGFNGLPRDVVDSEDRLLDRKKKYSCVIHAEENAILYAKRNLSGCCIYTYPFPCCARCSSLVIQVGITRVVCIRPSEEVLLRWKDDFALGEELMKEARVDLLKVPLSYIEG